MFHVEMEFSGGEYDNVFMEIDYERSEKRKRVSFKVTSGGEPFTAIFDYSANTSCYISSISDICSITSLGESNEYIEIIERHFPDLLFKNFRINIFPPALLFGIDPNRTFCYIGDQKPLEGFSCDTWLIPGLNGRTENIYFYWSQKGWDTSSGEVQPVGFRRVQHSSEFFFEEIVTVLNYIPGYNDPTAFNIPDGIVCESSTKQVRFPEMTKLPLFYFNTEVVKSHKTLVQTTEYWFDTAYRYGRIVAENITATPGIVVSTIDYGRGLVFEKNSSKLDCQVIKLNKWNPPVESMFNLTAGATPESSLSEFMSPPEMKWLYIGHKRHRNLDTKVWQGNRNDWSPVSSSNTSSVWEWHMRTHTSSGELVEENIPAFLRIVIKNSDSPDFPINSETLFQIYGFNADNKDIDDLDYFDITDCYKNTWMYHLQFRIKVDQKLTKNPNFVRNWRAHLSFYGEVSLLRIARPHVMLLSDKTTIFRFWLLDKHPNDFDDKVSKEDALQHLRKMIEDGSIFDENLNGVPVPGSLEVVPDSLEVVPTDPLPPATTLKPLVTTTILKSSTTQINTSTTSTRAPTYENTSFFSAGTAVGISIGSFLAGITIGGGSTLSLKVYSIKCRV